MPGRFEDPEGRPWTASTHLGWIVLIVALTSGMAALLLALYLAIWIRSKGRSAFPLYGFALPLLSLPVEYFVPASSLTGILAILSSFLWIAATYSLRSQIKRHYKEAEGWDIEIGPIFTFLFSVIYINYCLNPITFSEKSKLTSMNLAQTPQEANLRK